MFKTHGWQCKDIIQISISIIKAKLNQQKTTNSEQKQGTGLVYVTIDFICIVLY